jgi:hypothetical protein
MLEKPRAAFARRNSRGAPVLQPPSRRALLLWRTVLGIAVFLVLFAIVGLFVVPPVAKHYLVKGLTELFGRQVAIEDIDVNPFGMVAVMKGFSVKEPGASGVFVSCGELKVNLQAASIFRRAPILREVKLTDPYAHVVRNPDGRTDLRGRFARTAPVEIKGKDNVRDIELGPFTPYSGKYVGSKDARFPKPRDAIGIARTLPVEETEKLMLTNTQVSDDDLVDLAYQRGQVVKDFLTRSAAVALERVFLIAPKLEAPKPDDPIKGSRADFALK